MKKYVFNPLHFIGWIIHRISFPFFFYYLVLWPACALYYKETNHCLTVHFSSENDNASRFSAEKKIGVSGKMKKKSSEENRCPYVCMSVHLWQFHSHSLALTFADVLSFFKNRRYLAHKTIAEKSFITLWKNATIIGDAKEKKRGRKRGRGKKEKESEEEEMGKEQKRENKNKKKGKN